MCCEKEKKKLNTPGPGFVFFFDVRILCFFVRWFVSVGIVFPVITGGVFFIIYIYNHGFSLDGVFFFFFLETNTIHNIILLMYPL